MSVIDRGNLQEKEFDMHASIGWIRIILCLAVLLGCDSGDGGNGGDGGDGGNGKSSVAEDSETEQPATAEASRLPDANDYPDVLARVPRLEEAMQPVTDMLEYGDVLEVSDRLVAITGLVAARFWDANVLWSRRAEEARRFGIEEEIITAIGHYDAPEFNSTQEQAAYQFAIEMHTAGQSSEATYKSAVAEIPESGVIELATLVGFHTFQAMTERTFQLTQPEGSEHSLPTVEGEWIVDTSMGSENPDAREETVGTPWSPKAWGGAAPDLASSTLALGAYMLGGTGLEARLLEFAIMIPARHWNATVEWFAHASSARTQGVADDVIRAIGRREVPTFTESDEEAIYLLGMELFDEHRVTDATFDNAIEVLGEESVIDVLSVMGYYSIVAGVLSNAKYVAPVNAEEFPL
jgi:4-carboxymuconolactone decarboxylase